MPEFYSDRVSTHIDQVKHPITDPAYQEQCHKALAEDGALVLPRFFRSDAIETVVSQSLQQHDDVFYAGSTHNVYLTAADEALPDEHPFNRQIVSSKGLIADDQIPADSPLRDVYNSLDFQAFLCAVLGIDAVYPYADSLSSINVHFADEGRELGWHFDNSSFAVTMLLQAPEGGGRFEYVANARHTASGEMGFDTVASVLDGTTEPAFLDFDPGALVLFRGRDSLHRVTPTEGDTTRLLTVFAYNDEPGVKLSDSALRTFFGRSA